MAMVINTLIHFNAVYVESCSTYCRALNRHCKYVNDDLHQPLLTMKRRSATTCCHSTLASCIFTTRDEKTSAAN